MTALVLENLAAPPALARSLRMLLARLARALDVLVSARLHVRSRNGGYAKCDPRSIAVRVLFAPVKSGGAWAKDSLVACRLATRLKEVCHSLEKPKHSSGSIRAQVCHPA
jgi:hypothetical protein